MRITEDEIKLIQASFKGNVALLKIMRKVFLPEYDPESPLGQTVDLWSIADLSNVSPEECKIYFTARRALIMHMESQLLQLQILSETVLETPEEAKKRLKLDSTK